MLVMDIEKLNNEVICCRSAVKKARVVIIRKIIKKMKILKTCKLEAVKEKKLRKSERLFEKIQIMKKLKDDEVTKFALRNKDLEVFLKVPETDLKMKALASLANHEAVQRKVNSIKEQFLNQENELAALLDSLEEKREVLDNKIHVNSVKKKKVVGKDKSVTMKLNCKKNPAKVMLQIHELTNTSKGKSDESESANILARNKKQEITETSEKVEKIEDPFFIEKKVIMPKLVSESLSNKKNEKTEFPKKSMFLKNISQGLNGKTFKVNKGSNKIKIQKPVFAKEEEMLHPSWAAKKVKLIQPFEGKKLVFSDD